MSICSGSGSGITGPSGAICGESVPPVFYRLGLLLALVLPGLQQLILPILSGIPAWATYLMLLLFTADAVCSARILYVTGDIDQLRLLPAA